MNQQQEFLSETFHLLAQPITALRVTLELGLRKAETATGSQQVMEDCLRVVDRLMQDLAVFREVSSLDEPPALYSCDGRALLERCVEEMALIAQDSGIALEFSAEPADIECHEPMLQRAVFVLLDEMIACAPSGCRVAISLRRCEEGCRFEVCPGMPPGQRQKLCRKLMQFAGGSAIRFVSGCTSITFRESTDRQFPALSLTDKQLLTSH